MAISSLVVGGNAGARPPVGAFFGKSTPANDNSQKVSSDFISGDVMGSILGSISGISAELKKVQQFSKDVIKGFERLVVDMRKLNNDITAKFKSVNSQIKKDNMDFLRSITTRSSGEGLMPVGEAAAPGVPETKAKEQEQEKDKEKKSFLDSMLDLSDLANTAKDAFDLTKKYGPRMMQGARAFAGSAALLPTVLAGGLIALAYNRKQEQEANPEGAAKFDRSIASGSKRAEVIKGPEADKNAPNANANISRKVKAIPDFLYDEGVIPTSAMTEVKKVVDEKKSKGDMIFLKDGRYFDNKEQILRNPDGSPAEKTAGKPTNANDANAQGSQQSFRVGGEEAKEGSPLSQRQMIAVNMALTMNPENAKMYPAWLMDQYNKQKSGGQAATGAAPTGTTTTTTPEAPSASASAAPTQTPAPAPTAETGTPMKVADIPPSAAPADVPAEGNTPAAAEAGAPAPAAAPAPPAAATTGTPSKVEEDFSNLANVAGVQVEKGSDIPPKAMMALDAMMENDPQAAAKKYPAWVLEQYAKQNGNEAAPTGGATSQAAEMAGENVTGAGGAGGDNGGTGEPSADTGKTEGAPAPSAPSPPNVPADLEPPSQANKDTTPIVMNNESSSSSGSVTSGEADNTSGQNLPMNAQNEALTEYFAKQNIDYQ